MNDDMERAFEETFRMIEEQYKDNPQMAEMMKQMFNSSVDAYSGNAEIIFEDPISQQVKIDTERMSYVTTEDFGGELGSSIRNKVKLPFIMEFSEVEYERILYGIRPAGMDEKWIIVVVDDTVQFYRSWSPKELTMSVDLIRNGNHFVTENVLVSEEFLIQDWNSEDYIVRFANYLFNRLLLAKIVPFPFPEGMGEPMEQSMFRHGLVGSSIANGEQ